MDSTPEKAPLPVELWGLSTIAASVVAEVAVLCPQRAGAVGQGVHAALTSLVGPYAPLEPAAFAALGAAIFAGRIIPEETHLNVVGLAAIFGCAAGISDSGAVGHAAAWAAHAACGDLSRASLAFAGMTIAAILQRGPLRAAIASLEMPSFSLPPLPRRAARAVAAPRPVRAVRPESASPNYDLPETTLLNPPRRREAEPPAKPEALERALSSFGVVAKVVRIERGPTVTRYEVEPGAGVKVARIAALRDDLGVSLGCGSVRIDGVGIEIPHAQADLVTIREVLDEMPDGYILPVAIGQDAAGQPLSIDLARMPHLLIAGATASGKSVCVHSVITSVLATATPDRVQLLLIDPKRVELGCYAGLPHLVRDIVTDADDAEEALLGMVGVMEERLELLRSQNARNIEELNRANPHAALPYVVIVVDELAELMMAAGQQVETAIVRLAQLARAAGIHLVIATQRPSADVVTGLIKANIPARIAFAVSSAADSRIILDAGGAEQLVGRGDLLLAAAGAPRAIRGQGAMITHDETQRIVKHWKKQPAPPNRVARGRSEATAPRQDSLLIDAARAVIRDGGGSVAKLQRTLGVGHKRALALMEALEAIGVVGPHLGSKPRRVMMTLDEFEQRERAA